MQEQPHWVTSKVDLNQYLVFSSEINA